MIADLAGRAAANPTVPNMERQRAENFAAQLRASTVSKGGKDFYKFEGTASTVDTPYEMYDFFGPYMETVRSGAFDKTLAASPDVAFLVNHRGVTMARTTSGTLELGANPHLEMTAYANPKRQDVKDLALAIEDRDIDQMSFAFRITSGQWSPDFMEYYIDEVDLDRGDVSAVNYGANPTTSISMRAKQMFETIDHLEGPLLEEAMRRLRAKASIDAGEDEARAAIVEVVRADVQAGGRSLSILRAVAAS